MVDAGDFTRDLIGRLLRALEYGGPRPVGGAVERLSSLLLDLAKYFIHTAREPRGPQRLALMAVLTARNAAIEGDTATVDAFSRDWLGLSDPARWREAVENALLGDWVQHLGRGLLRDPDLLGLLHRHTRIEHRHLQPLWERRVRGRRLRLLQDPVAEGLVLADLIADPRRFEDTIFAAELADSRLAAVLSGLAPVEAAVAAAYAADPKASWTEAAAAAGHPAPEAFGDRVRRKLKRLGERHTARAHAVAVTR
ncbi:hypothetical protein ACFYNO_32825 [Kitasatospora sp. NPDC006697]|uniref:hypothetical protein n=1 Tax=Kitasatospora sp. NPDC006697 TaxID=3364020 RepID=UPI0036A48695